MRTRNNSPMKRIAAAVAAVAVLFGTAPAVAEQEALAQEVTQNRTWTVTNGNGTDSTIETAVPASEVPASETATAPSPSAKSEQLTVKPQMNTVTEPELAEDVTFEHAGTTPDGKEEYTLEAKLNLPVDETTEQTLPLDRISLMRTKGSLDIDSVEDVAIDGTTLDDASVGLFTYPDNPSDDEKAHIPDEVTGDVITLDTSATTLDAEAVVTATVYANKKASRDVKWELYRGDLPVVLEDVEVEGGAEAPGAAPPTIDPKSPVPANHARVVVQVAGDYQANQNSATKVTGRLGSVYRFSPGAGAELQLYPPLNDKDFGNTQANLTFTVDNPRTPIDQPWATCTADANGECVFDIPRSGPDVHQYYWVGATKASPGFEVQDLMRVGASGDRRSGPGGTLFQYAYATPKLEAGKTYYSGVHYRRGSGNGADWEGLGLASTTAFMYEDYVGGGSTRRQRSSLGAFQQVRSNPPLPDACQGLSVAVVVDASGSMGKNGEATIKGLLTDIVSGLQETSTSMSMFSFATDSPARGNPPNLSEPSPLNTEAGRQKVTNWINSYRHVTESYGSDTNWYAALRNVHSYNQKNPSKPYDLVYFITDGNPTRQNNDLGNPELDHDEYGEVTNRNGSNTEFRDVEAAMSVANAVKAQGTRIVAVGIPSAWPGKRPPTAENQLALSDENLQAISGQLNGGENTTDLRAADFAQFTDSEVVKRAILDSLDCDPKEFNFNLNKVNAVPRQVGDETVYDPLMGALFELEGLDRGNSGVKEPVTSAGPETDKGQSEFRWENLRPGRYKLTETKPADDGYVMLAESVYFRVSRDGDSLKTFILTGETDEEGIEITRENEGAELKFPVVEFAAADSGLEVTMKVANTKIGELPKTGGRGVFIQFLASLLILLAGVLTARVTRRLA